MRHCPRRGSEHSGVAAQTNLSAGVHDRPTPTHPTCRPVPPPPGPDPLLCCRLCCLASRSTVPRRVCVSSRRRCLRRAWLHRRRSWTWRRPWAGTTRQRRRPTRQQGEREGGVRGRVVSGAPFIAARADVWGASCALVPPGTQQVSSA